MRHLSKVSIKATSGNRSEGTISRPPSEPLSDQKARKSVSPRRTLACTPSVQGVCGSPHGAGGPRHHPSVGGGGVATRLSATSTLWQRVSPKAYQPRCLNMAPTRSLYQLNLENSSTRRSRALKDPSTRGFWRPGIGSVWSWRHKYFVFSPL